MKLPHNKFCVLPWISLETSPIGTVRPCCLAKDEIVNENSEKFELLNASLDEVRHSDHMRELRQEFLNGKCPATCANCWNEEDVGRTSKRMHTLDRLKDILDEDAWTEEPKDLMFIDFKLGNICNLKCRICGSWSSSTYATEEIKTFPKEQQKESYPYQMLRQGAWPRENSSFWDELAKNMSKLRYLEFTGGEPFMIREHFEFLEKLVGQGLAKDIEVHYNTNGTQWPDGAAEIWEHFKHVEVAFSVDDVGNRFEYQRSGASWDEVNANLSKFKKLRDGSGNMSLQVCCTVNVFNVYYLTEVANWIKDQSFDFVYWNMLHDAKQHCITSLPTNAKKSITKRLLNDTVPLAYREEFKRIADFMNASEGVDRVTLLRDIRTLDGRRNESLSKDHVELAYLIGYE